MNFDQIDDDIREKARTVCRIYPGDSANLGDAIRALARAIRYYDVAERNEAQALLERMGLRKRPATLQRRKRKGGKR